MVNGNITVSLDGITAVPPGHAAAIKYYLERPADDALPPCRHAPAGIRLERLGSLEEPRYRAIFRQLGQRWPWWSRLMLSEKDLGHLLEDTAIEAYAVMESGRDIGLLEWNLSDAEAPELAFLGLAESHIGCGLGSWLMSASLTRLAAPPASIIRVNTCTFDSPQALAYYRRHGFRLVRTAVEIVPDPRLHNILPRHAAPHVPLNE